MDDRLTMSEGGVEEGLIEVQLEQLVDVGMPEGNKLVKTKKLVKKEELPELANNGIVFRGKIASVGYLPLYWRELMETMACLNCGGIPAPDSRYMCQEGHMFCQDCGVERLQQHAGYCLADLKREMGVDIWLQDKNPVCGFKVQLVPNDPVYNAILSNTSFPCPHNCGEILKGNMVFAHMAQCNHHKQL